MHQRVRRVHYLIMLMAMALSLFVASTERVVAHPGDAPPDPPFALQAPGTDQGLPGPLQAAADVTCADGSAAGYPCHRVDLLAFVPLREMGGTRSKSATSDIWGWTDPETGREYAIVGRVFGTSFLDISEPAKPVYLGELPTHGPFHSLWRDIKVYANHAFIVSEARNHGMQVFDLTQLRAVKNAPARFSETAFYDGVGSAHNLAINEDSGFAYIVGARGKNDCGGGLHMVDIRNPTDPTFAGCFAADGYTHDAQCVLYSGPDADHQGQEICLNSNEDTLTLVDVTNKSNPVQLSRTGYPGSGYSHQGWLTEDQRFFLLDDELDEQNYGHNTRTRIWDVSDLDSPALIGFFDNTTPSMDHNLYIRGRFAYQANYRSGLRVLDIGRVAAGHLEEVAFFDIYPADDAARVSGAWSNYPYFASGVVIVSGIEQGLFILRPDLHTVPGDKPPSATIIHPAEGGTVVGTLPITVHATDDRGVAQVEFFVDDIRLGIDTRGDDGWALRWASATARDGDHTLHVTATDILGQTGSDRITVTVGHAAGPNPAVWSPRCRHPRPSRWTGEGAGAPRCGRR
jgi:choice-of-anchor B domain-containing protein